MTMAPTASTSRVYGAKSGCLRPVCMKRTRDLKHTPQKFASKHHFEIVKKNWGEWMPYPPLVRRGHRGPTAYLPQCQCQCHWHLPLPCCSFPPPFETSWSTTIHYDANWCSLPWSFVYRCMASLVSPDVQTYRFWLVSMLRSFHLSAQRHSLLFAHVLSRYCYTFVVVQQL